MTPEEQEIYDSELKRKWDNEAVKEQQRLDFEAVQEQQCLDFEEEKERSRIEAEERKALEIALTLKKMGLPNEQISEGTGLSIDEIEKL